MTVNATPRDRQLALAPLDENVNHVRGAPAGHLILEYGDYECPYSRQAFHAIQHIERELGGTIRFAFRHFPLTGIHPHALAAAAAAEAAALQGRFWDMHELLFHRQKALETATCAGTPSSSAWTRRSSTRTGPSRRWLAGSAGTWTAAWPRARCSAPPPCSSTVLCTAAATTRPPCWPRWPGEPPGRPADGDQKPRRSLTMIAVTRPGVTALLMMRMWLTPLGTP